MPKKVNPIDNPAEFRPATVEDIFSHRRDFYDEAGGCWRRNGAVKTWARPFVRPDGQTEVRFRLPVKHGLWDYDTVDNSSLQYLWVKL